MGRPTGQLEKSLAALTIGVAQSRQRRERALTDSRTGEFEQQVRVPISGQAGTTWGWVDRRVNFDMPFLWAPLQRQVPFPTPQFYHGVELNQTTKTLVLVQPHILRWSISPEGWCVGAWIRFAVQAPSATEPIPYKATVHLTFQGYGTAAGQEEDQ